MVGVLAGKAAKVLQKQGHGGSVGGCIEQQDPHRTGARNGNPAVANELAAVNSLGTLASTKADYAKGVPECYGTPHDAIASLRTVQV